MRSTIRHLSIPALLVLAGLTGPAAATVAAQDPTYVPTPGLSRVKMAVARLKREGDKLPAQTRQELLAEGEAILALEQAYYDGKTPLQAESRKADEKTASLDREARDLEERIKAFNIKAVRPPEEAAMLNELRTDLLRRIEAHNNYVNNDLNRRIDADNNQLIARYAAFARNVEAAFLPKGRQPSFRPFEPLRKTYEERRAFARLVAGEEDKRCAVVLSAALDLRPDWERHRELSLADLDPDKINSDYRGNPLLKNFYIRAGQLADRLEREWGSSERWRGEEVRIKGAEALKGKRGVVFFEGGFGTSGDGNHIDLWDGTKMEWAAATKTTFDQAIRRAKSVRFWQIPD